MINNYDWLSKKNLRSIAQLRLWGDNPRLDPENTYLTTKEFAEEITNTESDRNNFLDIVRSITTLGYIPADPVVVWQNENNQKYYVAEGNRRVLAMKLLRQPNKSPKSIKGMVLKLSRTINRDDFEKIPVCVAPTFEDAEWYISQRHSTSSLQKRWSTEQQMRWIADLYEKYRGNTDIIKSKINISESELQAIIRTLKVKSYTKEIKTQLTDEEYAQATSHNFPITTLDRFLNNSSVREKWGINYNGYDVEIKNQSSFLIAFSMLIKRILLPVGDKERIDSRSIRTSDNIVDVLSTLPIVDDSDSSPTGSHAQPETNNEGSETSQDESVGEIESSQPEETQEERRNKLKNNPYRTRLILPFYEIDTDSHKLASLFGELKAIPLRYQNSVAASIRIFLDLAVSKYIETEQLEGEIGDRFNRGFRDVVLKQRIEFVKTKMTDRNCMKIIDRLLNPENEFSLDVLNGYMHNHETHYLSSQFLNRFWDFLFPLLTKLVVIKEN